MGAVFGAAPAFRSSASPNETLKAGGRSFTEARGKMRLRSGLVAFGFKPIYLPWIGAVPAPTEVLAVWGRVLTDPGYWQSWYMSFFRVMTGFFAAMLIGIPKRSPGRSV